MSVDTANEWDEILKGKWKAYDVEKSLYVDSVNKANSPEERAKIICDGLRDGDVPCNLAKLYVEAVYGTNEKVKSRIISHTYFIGRSCCSSGEGCASKTEVNAMIGMDANPNASDAALKKTTNMKEGHASNDTNKQAEILKQEQHQTAYSFDVSLLLKKTPCTRLGKEQWEMSDEPKKQKEIADNNTNDLTKSTLSAPTGRKFEDIPLAKGDVILNDTENENAHDPYELFSSPPRTVDDGPKMYGKLAAGPGRKATAEYKKIMDKKFEEAKKMNDDKVIGASVECDEKNVKMEDIFESFNQSGSRKRKAKIQTQEMKEDIRKMTKLANSALIDHKALIKADFARKGMNLKKYHQEVIDDLSDASEGHDESVPQQNKNVSSNSTNCNDTDIIDDYDTRFDHEHANQLDCARVARNYNKWISGDYTYIKEYDLPEE